MVAGRTVDLLDSIALPLRIQVQISDGFFCAARRLLHDHLDIAIGSAIVQELALKDVVGVGRVRRRLGAPNSTSGEPVTLPFEFVKAHFDELMKDNPSIFGNSFGSFLPYGGSRFSDAESRKQLQDYFAPLVQIRGRPGAIWRKRSKVWTCASRGC